MNQISVMQSRTYTDFSIQHTFLSTHTHTRFMGFHDVCLFRLCASLGSMASPVVCRTWGKPRVSTLHSQ